MSFFVTGEGGLTTAGYALFLIIAFAAFFAAIVLDSQNSKTKFSAQKLAFCGVAIALSYVCSFIQLFKLPYGGSVTLFSMLFIVLLANWYGLGTGILAGFVYGVLQFLQEPYFLSVLQVCSDYLLAFAALGLAGFFSQKKHGLSIGYAIGVFGRGVFASFAGYLFWMDYMPENFPKTFASVYPIIYNYSYLLAEAVLTLIIINIPAVKSAIARIRDMAVTP